MPIARNKPESDFGDATQHDSRHLVLQQLHQAFAERHLGDGMSLEEAAECEDGASLKPRPARDDRKSVWWQVADVEIERFYEGLSLLDNAGFGFYLPAYMSWSLRHFAQSDSQTTDWTIYALWPDPERGDFEQQVQRYQQFNPAQVFAICQFLALMANAKQGQCDDDAAQQALQTFWLKHAASLSGLV